MFNINKLKLKNSLYSLYYTFIAEFIVKSKILPRIILSIKRRLKNNRQRSYIWICSDALKIIYAGYVYVFIHNILDEITYTKIRVDCE